MANDPENLTLQLLREMRADMKAIRAEMQEGFDHLGTRIDGLAHILTVLAGNTYQHEERIARLEERNGAVSPRVFQSLHRPAQPRDVW